MLLVTLTCKREYAPNIRFAASGRENLSLITGNSRRGFVHLFRVIHNAVRRVLRENNQVHTRQTLFHAHQHFANLVCVVQHLSFRMKSRHLVVNYRHPNAVFATRNITVSHVCSPFLQKLIQTTMSLSSEKLNFITHRPQPPDCARGTMNHPIR